MAFPSVLARYGGDFGGTNINVFDVPDRPSGAGSTDWALNRIVVCILGLDHGASGRTGVWDFGTELLDGAGIAEAGLHIMAHKLTSADLTRGKFTFTLDSGAVERGGWMVRVIDPATMKNGTVADVQVGTRATGLSTAPDPPSFSPTGGAADRLAMALCAVDNGNTTISAFPSGYSNTSQQTGGTAGGAVLGYAEKQITAATEDAGAFTASASEEWDAVLLTIDGATATAISVAGVSAATSTSSAALAQQRPVAGLSSATSTSSGSVLVGTFVAGVSASTSTSSGSIVQQRPIAGVSAATATSTASAALDAPIRAFSAGVSTSSGALAQQRPIAGLSAATSTSSGRLVGPANWEVYINGVNRTANVRPFDAIRIVNRIFEGSGTATIPIRDDTGALSISTEMEVHVVQREDTLFKGLVRRVVRGDRGWSTGPRTYLLECQDYTTLLDDDVIETAFRSATESDKARIAWLVSTFGTRGVTAGAEVQTLLASMPVGTDGRPEQDFSGKTLREAIEDVARLSGGRYYVDYDKKLHYFATESTAAPYALSDAYNGSTSVGFWDLRLDDDSIDLCHEVLVVGTGVKVWRSIAAPPALGQRRRAVLRDDDITTVAQANDAGDAYLDRFGTARNTGTVMTRAPGFRAGQVVNITHTGHGLSATPYLIAGVTASTDGPEEVNFQLELNDAQLDLGDVIGTQRRTIDVLAQQTTSQGAALRELQAAGANLVPDSSFEASTNSAWTVGTGWTHGAAHSSAAFRGQKVAKLVRSGNTAGDLVLTNYISVDRTSDYWFSVWSDLESRTAGTARIEVREYNASNTLLATTTLADITAAQSDWTRHSIHFGPSEQVGRRAFNASTTKVKVAFNTAGASATMTWYVDGVQVERGKLLTAYAPMPEELSNVPGEVVIDSSGITIVNGALTVKNPGGTVIIDGTSEMFKIQATGTIAGSAPGVSAGSFGSGALFSNVDTGIPSLSGGKAPAFLCYITGAYSSTERHQGRFLQFGGGYVASTSGGTVTEPRLNPVLAAEAYVQTGTTFNVTISGRYWTSQSSSYAFEVRWYILKEAGI